MSTTTIFTPVSILKRTSRFTTRTSTPCNAPHVTIMLPGDLVATPVMSKQDLVDAQQWFAVNKVSKPTSSYREPIASQQKSMKLSSVAEQQCDDWKDEPAEQLQAEKDNFYDVCSGSKDSKEDNCEVAETEAMEIDEEELVNSEQIAKTHRVELMEAATEQYKRETGSAPTQQMVVDAMQTRNRNDSLDAAQMDAALSEPAEVEDEVEVGGVTAEEMESALEHVRSLGRQHREELESSFRAQFSDINGAEPSSEELCGIFARVREALAEEARDELLDIHGQEELEGDSDSDYKPSADDVAAESEDIDAELADLGLRDDGVLSSEESEVASIDISDHELDFALKHVCDLASLHQGEFVNCICDIFAELNGSEPSLAELYEVFADMPQAFAEEANGNTGGDDFDGDYEPSDDSFDSGFAENLASLHQSEVVDRICDIDIFAEDMFEAIKQALADEAAEVS